MKRLFENRIFLGAICFILGGGVMFAAQTAWKRPEHSQMRLARNMNSFLDDSFNDDFFGRSHDPFEQMRKMRQRMLKQFDEPEEGGGIFDNWFQKKFGGGSVGDISRRDDDKYVYYDIAVRGLKQEKVNVRVEDGQITISGQVENKSDDEGTQSFTSSSFHRSFPVPDGVDPNKVQMEQAKDKLVVRFPKLGA
jgi:HSP20 family molecular chaperone IbpA